MALLTMIVTTAYSVPLVGDVVLRFGTELIRTVVILVTPVIVAFTVYRLVAHVIRRAPFTSQGTEGGMKLIVGLWRLIVARTMSFSPKSSTRCCVLVYLSLLALM